MPPAASPARGMRRCTSWARCCGTAARHKNASTCPRSPPADQVKKPSDGLSVFLIDMSAMNKGQGLEVRPIKAMINHNTTEIFFDNFRIPASSLIGEEGKGFRYILDGMNAARILGASEAIGDGRWFIKKATQYAKDRVVFGAPIGKNQGVQFPIARAWAELEAADMVCRRAAARVRK